MPDPDVVAPGTPRTLACVRQALLVQSAQLADRGQCPEGVYVAPDAEDMLRWNGVVFVRDGFYAAGVFRFSVLFSAHHDSLAMPTVHFPALLLHPQMEPASGRICLSPFEAQLSASGITPGHPLFLSRLLGFLHDCFQTPALDTLVESDSLNQRMFQYVAEHVVFLAHLSLYHEDRELFAQLAAKSASLSTTDTALFDAYGGSGVPADADVLIEYGGIPFRRPGHAPALEFSEMDDHDIRDVLDQVMG